MGYVVLYAAIIVIVAAATGLLQLLIWAVAIAIQMATWAFWTLASGLSIAWLAIFDRRELARIWREADPKRRSPFAFAPSTPAPRSSWNV